MNDKSLSLEEIKSEASKFSARLSRPSPKGCCLEISHEFTEILGSLGHTCVSVQFGFLDEKDHSWVEAWEPQGKSLLIDFTADQFGPKFPPLIIGDRDMTLDQYGYVYDCRDENEEEEA